MTIFGAERSSDRAKVQGMTACMLSLVAVSEQGNR